jgi:hypothetical protein
VNPQCTSRVEISRWKATERGHRATGALIIA